MRFRNGVVLTAACLSSFVLCQAQNGHRPEYVLRMEWSQVELTAHGTIGGTCAIIWPDGRYHSEHRAQTLPSTVAKLTVYDSSLNAKGLTEVQRILDSEDVRELPAFGPAVMPPYTAASYAFTVDIQRPEGLQHKGFEQFGLDGHDGWPLDAREDARPDDERSRMTLGPILQWMQSELDRAEPNPVGKADLCSH